MAECSVIRSESNTSSSIEEFVSVTDVIVGYHSTTTSTVPLKTDPSITDDTDDQNNSLTTFEGLDSDQYTVDQCPDPSPNPSSTTDPPCDLCNNNQDTDTPCYRNDNPAAIDDIDMGRRMKRKSYHLQDDTPSNVSNGNYSSKQGKNGVSPTDVVHNYKKGYNEEHVLPSYTLKATAVETPVMLRLGDSTAENHPPITVHTLLRNAALRCPTGTAVSVKRGGVWVSWNYRDYYQQCRTVAKAFIKLGLEQHHGVGILGFNSPEWFMADMGCIMAGGLGTGMYTTSTPEACLYVAADSKCNIIVVENNTQLMKILQIRDELPHLKAIVQYIGTPATKQPNVYSWAEMLAMADDVSESVLEDRIHAQAPNQCCTLIYTSGTTGNPKGVMLSHDNLTWTIQRLAEHCSLKNGAECIVSYLPLSHIAAQIMDIYVPLAVQGSCYFAQPDALKGSLIQTLKEIKPTGFLGVPRVWEKIQERMQQLSQGITGVRKKLAVWAKDVGLRGTTNLGEGKSLPWGWSLANILLFKKVRLGLGLERCKHFYSGAAPICRDTVEYFMSLNIPLVELFGMSECTGPHVACLPLHNRMGSVGINLPGVKTKVINKDENGCGELCLWGRNVCMGYVGMKETTDETIRNDGWLQTGDLAKIDPNGFVYITGRIKELIITAGGENIAPVLIEDVLKEECPIISNCQLIGDKKKFLSCLITIKCDIDDNTYPTDTLSPAALNVCQQVGSPSTLVSQINDGSDSLINSFIQAGIDKANERAISRAQKIQKWKILPRDFSIPGGELGPTMKLRRPIVCKMYADIIDGFYDDE